MDFPFLIVSDDAGNALTDQQFLPANLPGGWGAGSSDPTGINGSDPGSTNPNPNGGWQNVALQVSRMALAAFQTYEAGSTAASTPPRRVPGTVITAPGVGIGGISQSTITTGLFVIAGGILLFVLVKVARK